MLNSSVLSSIIGDQRLTELISEDDIKKRIKDIAADISKEYKGRIPIVIGVLNGSFLFLADIVRKLDVEFEVDFIKISSYGTSKTSSGNISGSGFANAKIRGLLAIDLTIFLFTIPPFESPRKTSLSFMAFSKFPSSISRANSSLYTFNSPLLERLIVKIPFESTMSKFSFLTPKRI